MKFKYKKIILLITLCTMFIGMVTISLTTPKEVGVVKTKGPGLVDENFVELGEESDLLMEAGIEEKNSDLTSNASDEIKGLVANYFKCMLTCDLEEMSKIVTQVENIDVEEMQAKRNLIEQYQNLECYIMDGRSKGEYLVYVYSELKFTGIDTAAPGLTRLYIVTQPDGSLQIELGLIKQEVQDYIAEADESEHVKKIIDTVNYKLEQAINKDEKFREFYTNLNGGSDKVDTESVDENQEEGTAAPTDEPLEDTEAVNE